MKTIDVFRKTIEENELLEKGDKVVIGVSGGPDSLCLLHLFYSVKEEFSLEIIVVHLDHRYRGEESRQDALYVKKFCDRLSIKSYIFSEDVENYSLSKGISFEEAGREIRYKLFYQVAKENAADRIAVAQNKNDQAETVLMRLMRGAGIDGLSSIAYKRDDIIRPLLDVDRDSIEKYCEEYDLKPRIDKTNLQAIYHRNKIRLELIPYLQQNFNPNIIDTLWRSARLFQDDKSSLDRLTKDTLKIINLKKIEYGVSFELESFNNLDRGMKKRVVRSALSMVKGNLKDVSNTNIIGIIDLIKNKRVSSEINIVGSLVGVVKYNTFEIKDTSKLKENNGFEYPLTVGQDLYINEIDATITIEEMDKLLPIEKNNNTIVIDADKVKGNLKVRTRKLGDRFTPIGMRGSQKIKDFYINVKIPKERRDLVPLICDDKEIIWVAPYRLNNNYKLSRDAKKVIKITII